MLEDESTVALELVAYLLECPSLEEDIRHSTFGRVSGVSLASAGLIRELTREL